ncbi:MAG: hypothetical protein ACW98K_15385, partial [Candidatus Kariarchaeaceae archaeon]
LRAVFHGGLDDLSAVIWSPDSYTPVSKPKQRFRFGILIAFVVGLFIAEARFIDRSINIPSISLNVKFPISLIISILSLIFLRRFRSFLYLSSESITFRNHFRTVYLPLDNIASIETVVTTYDKVQGRVTHRMGDHITFRTKRKKKRNFYIQYHKEGIIGAMKKFAMKNDVEFSQTWKEDWRG